MITIPDMKTSEESILTQFIEVRKFTNDLCKPLKIEDYIPQPVPFISPPKWHLAHTTWFFEEFVLKPFFKGYQVFHKDFSYLFNSYYNAVGKRILRADRGNITRPGVEEVYAYRKYVDAAMLELMEGQSSAALEEVIVLGLNHEQQHQELLITDLKYILGHNPISPVYKEGFSLASGKNSRTGQIDLKEGVYQIGYGGNGFHYDNELGIHKVYLHEAKIDDHLITNKDYMEFIEDNGYEQSSLWLDEGLAWVKEHEITAPLYWHKIDGQWFNYKLSGLDLINPEELLCHVSFYEAAAYAEWSGKRLLTEFEWEIASTKFDWGQRWEWTNSAYLPYPGFSTVEGAIGEYNGKFMINQMVLRGASNATAPDHSRDTYRNFFHPNLRWQCTGIRLAEKHSL